MKNGIELIADERQKQIAEHGYNNDHDQDHYSFELTKAAICYADRATMEWLAVWQDRTPERWPFEASEWKPLPQIPGHPCPIITKDDAVKMLVKAGALIAAEIDRLQSRVEPTEFD